MNIGKSLVVALAAAALALTACTSGTNVGEGLNTDINVRDSSPPPSSKKPPPKKSPSKKPETKKPPATSSRKIEQHTVEAQTGFQYEPLDVYARKGDKLTFKNVSTDSDHSFTLEGGEYDSGVVKPGDQVSFTVALDSGTYNFMCTVVPYMVGGKLHVA